MAWEEVLAAAEAEGIASNGTLNKVRTKLAKSGKIMQVGRARKAKWKRLADADEDEST